MIFETVAVDCTLVPVPVACPSHNVRCSLSSVALSPSPLSGHAPCLVLPAPFGPITRPALPRTLNEWWGLSFPLGHELRTHVCHCRRAGACVRCTSSRETWGRMRDDLVRSAIQAIGMSLTTCGQDLPRTSILGRPAAPQHFFHVCFAACQSAFFLGHDVLVAHGPMMSVTCAPIVCCLGLRGLRRLETGCHGASAYSWRGVRGGVPVTAVAVVLVLPLEKAPVPMVQLQ